MFITVLLSTYIILFFYFGLFALKREKNSLLTNFFASNMVLFSFALCSFVLLGLYLINDPSLVYGVIAGYELYSIAHVFIYLPLLILVSLYFLYVYGKRHGYIATIVYLFVISTEALILSLLFALAVWIYYPIWFLQIPLMSLLFVSLILHYYYIGKTSSKRDKVIIHENKEKPEEHRAEEN